MKHDNETREEKENKEPARAIRKDVCDMCSKIGGMGITRGTSMGHILCYECADKAVKLDLISEDCDNLLYDYENDALGKYLIESKIARGAEDFLNTLIELSKKEGDRFEAENGRRPSEQEAKRIAEMIERQVKTALILTKSQGAIK